MCHIIIELTSYLRLTQKTHQTLSLRQITPINQKGIIDLYQN